MLAWPLDIAPYPHSLRRSAATQAPHHAGIAMQLIRATVEDAIVRHCGRPADRLSLSAHGYRTLWPNGAEVDGQTALPQRIDANSALEDPIRPGLNLARHN